MKSSLLCAVFSLFLTCGFSQWGDNYIKLSENITTETKNITGFDKIEVSEDFKVYIRFSDSAEVVQIRSNENLHDLIKVEKSSSTLKIYTESYSTSSGTRRGGAQEKLVAYITANKLSGIKGNEDVEIVLKDKLYADNLTIDLDEDSTLEGYIEARNLIVKLNEDSFLDVEGLAETMKVKADEDSGIKGYDFIVGDLEIDLNEDSEVKLTVNGEIDLRAKEDSYFSYKGKGEFIRKRLTGDSEAKRL